MKKYYFLIIVALILGLVLTGCSLLSNISQVPATDQSGVTSLTKTVLPLLFSDDFNDDNADGWMPVGTYGDWKVEFDADFGSGVYSQGDTTWTTTSTYDTYWRSYGDDSWTDYTFETKVKIVEGGSLAPIAGIFFRVQGTDLNFAGYYMFRIDARPDTGPALIESPNTILAGGHPGYLQFVNEPADIGVIYTLKVIVEGSHIKCYVNDVMKIDWTDDTYTTGRVGVGTFNSHTHFDDVLISDIYYTWTGFLPPVDNVELNVAKAGRAIPLKFSLGGNQGLEPEIFATGYPKSIGIECPEGGDFDSGELPTVTAGNSSLYYDADADQYTYVWKTLKEWAGTCRKLVILLNDGTLHEADFTFK